MIRSFMEKDRSAVDASMEKLQMYFANIDSTQESLVFNNLENVHRYMQKMLDDCGSMNGTVFVAEEDSQVAGFIQGVIIEHKHGADVVFDTTHNERKDGWIGLLYVDENQRGKGIGRALMDKIKEHFIENGCDTARLLVLNDNINAINMYQKYGFINHDVEMVKSLK